MEMEYGWIMDSTKAAPHSRDILASPCLAFAFFWLPAIAIAVTGRTGFGNGLRTVVWTAALSVMGTACIANALRCRRLHCYLTGPFLLAMAAVTLLFGLGAIPLGGSGWSFISLAIVGGVVVLCCLPEMFFGKYRKVGAKGGGHC